MIATHAVARARRFRLPAVVLLLIATGLPATATDISTCDTKLEVTARRWFLNLGIWDVHWLTGPIQTEAAATIAVTPAIPRKWDDSVVCALPPTMARAAIIQPHARTVAAVKFQ